VDSGESAGLSGLDAFLFGALGGAIAAIVVYVLPELINAAQKDEVNFTLKRGAFMVLLVVVLAAVAGVFLLIPHVEDRGKAIGLGLGAQTAIKGLIAAGKEATQD
jgi:hypothetical protein